MDIKDQEWLKELENRLHSLELEKKSIEEELSVKSNWIDSLNNNKASYLSNEYINLYANILKLQHRYAVISQYLSWFDKEKELEETDEFLIVKYGMMVELKKDNEFYTPEKLSEEYIKFVNAINRMTVEKEITSRDAIELQERLYYRYASYVKRVPINKKNDNPLIQLLLDQQRTNIIKKNKLEKDIIAISEHIKDIEKTNGQNREKTTSQELDELEYKYDLVLKKLKIEMLLSNYKKIIRQQDLQIYLETNQIPKTDYHQLMKTASLIDEKKCLQLKIEILTEEKEYLNKKAELYNKMFEMGEISKEELYNFLEDIGICLKENRSNFDELNQRIEQIEENNLNKGKKV